MNVAAGNLEFAFGKKRFPADGYASSKLDKINIAQLRVWQKYLGRAYDRGEATGRFEDY